MIGHVFFKILMRKIWVTASNKMGHFFLRHGYYSTSGWLTPGNRLLATSRDSACLETKVDIKTRIKKNTKDTDCPRNLMHGSRMNFPNWKAKSYSFYIIHIKRPIQKMCSKKRYCLARLRGAVTGRITGWAPGPIS